MSTGSKNDKTETKKENEKKLESRSNQTVGGQKQLPSMRDEAAFID